MFILIWASRVTRACRRLSASQRLPGKTIANHFRRHEVVHSGKHLGSPNLYSCSPQFWCRPLAGTEIFENSGYRREKSNAGGPMSCYPSPGTILLSKVWQPRTTVHGCHEQDHPACAHSRPGRVLRSGTWWELVENNPNAGESAVLIRKSTLQGRNSLHHMISPAGRDHLITLRSDTNSLMIGNVHLEPNSTLMEFGVRLRTMCTQAVLPCKSWNPDC